MEPESSMEEVQLVKLSKKEKDKAFNNQEAPANETKKKYPKRPGTSGLEGHLYELRLAMMYCLICERKVAKNEIQSFNLMANVDDVGSFDDVVLAMKWKNAEEIEKSKTLFVQLKHKVNANKKQFSDEVLLGLFTNYLSEQFYFKSIYGTEQVDENEWKFESQWNDNIFIFYTNQTLKINKNRMDGFKKCNLDPKSVSNFDKEKYYYELDAIKCIEKEMKSSYRIMDVFVSKLAPALVKYISKDDRDTVNDNEKINFDKNYGILKTVMDIKIIDKDNEEATFKRDENLTDTQKIFKHKLIEKIKKMSKKSLNYGELIISLRRMANHVPPGEFKPIDWPNDFDEFESFLNQIHILDSRSGLNDLEKLLKEQIKTEYLTRMDDAELCFKYVSDQIMEWFLNDQNPIDENRKFFMSTVELILSNVLKPLSSVYFAKIPYIKQFNFRDIGNLEDAINHNQIIHIVNAKNMLDFSIAKVYQILRNKDESKYFFNDLTTFLSLNRDDVLKGEHFGKIDYLVIQTKKSVSKFKSEDKIFFDSIIQSGKKIIVISDDKFRFGRSSGIIKYIKIQDQQNKLTDLDENSQVEFLKNYSVDFQERNVPLKDLVDGAEILKEFINGDIFSHYFITYDKWSNKSDSKECEKSISCQAEINLTFKQQNGDNYVNSKNILEDVRHKVLILSAPSGGGKSMFLKTIAKKMKDINPLLWTIEIDLTDSLFKNAEVSLNAVDKCAEVIKFIEKTLNVSWFFKHVLDHRIRVQGKISLLIDGLDKISSQYRKEIQFLMNSLQNTKVDQICITSCPQMAEEIADELKIPLYCLEPLSKEEQKKIIFNMWEKDKDKDYSFNENHIRVYIDKLFEFLSSFFFDKKLEFTGIPLYTNIFGAFYKRNFKKWSQKQSNELLPNDSDLIDLYQYIVDEKFNSILKIDRQRLEDNHNLLALAALFSTEEIKTMIGNDWNTLQTLLDSVQMGDEHVGFITKIIDRKPLFVDRTVAEFFAANWFAQNFKNDSTKRILHETLINTSFINFRKFYGRLVIKNWNAKGSVQINSNNNHPISFDEFFDKIKNASDEKNISDIKQLIQQLNPEIQNDYLLRTVKEIQKQKTNEGNLILQVLADENTDKLINENNLKEVRKLARECPEYRQMEDKMLHQAIEDRNLDQVKHILRRGIDVNQSIPSNKWTPLTKAVNIQAFYIVKYLLDQGAQVNKDDLFKWTPIHRAIDSQNQPIVQLLLDSGANVNEPSHSAKWLPLVRAICVGSLPIVKMVFEKTSNQIESDQKSNLLRRAIHKGLYEIVDFLQKNWVVIDIMTYDTATRKRYDAIKNSGVIETLPN